MPITITPELVDWNLQIVNINGIDHLVNYGNTLREGKFKVETDNLAISPTDGAVNNACFYNIPNGTRDSIYLGFIQLKGKDYTISATNQFTITGWYKIPRIANMQVGYYIYNYLCYTQTDSSEFQFWREVDGNTRYVKNTTNLNVQANEWFYLTFVRDGNWFYWFVNGETIVADKWNHLYANYNLAYLQLRCGIHKGPWNTTTYLDDIVVCREVLWTDDFEPPTEPLIGIPDEDKDLDLLKCQNRRMIIYPFYSDDDMLKVY